MALLLDTSELLPADQEEALRATLSAASGSARLEVHGEGHTPASRIEGWQLGSGMTLLHVDCCPHRFTRSASMVRRSAPERLSLSLSLSGRSTLSHGGHTWVGGRGDMRLVDLTTEFDHHQAGRADIDVLYVDYDVLDLPVDVVRAAALRLQSSPVHPLVRRHLQDLRLAVAPLEGNPAAALLGEVTLDLVRALLVSAAPQGRRLPAVLAQSLFTCVTTYMRWHLGDPALSQAQIADRHNVSVTFLASLFAEQGTTIADWMRTRRLEGARRQLIRQDPASPSVVTLAARTWGFTSPRQFTREFRAAYGTSPREMQQWQHCDAKS